MGLRATGLFCILLLAMVLVPAVADAQLTVDYILIQPVPTNNLVNQIPPGTACARIVGNGIDEHTEQITVFGYNNGPNGVSENGGGDDIAIGNVPATFTATIGSISTTGLWTAPMGATATGQGTITANYQGLQDSMTCIATPPDFVPNSPPPIANLTCSSAGAQVSLSWTNGATTYGSIEVSRNGVVVATLGGSATTYQEAGLVPGAYYYEVRGYTGGNPTKPPAYCSSVVTVVTIAQFSANPTSGGSPLVVQFNDQSSGVINSWAWDFGDGNTSTDPSPLHIYQQPGLYTVSLTVSGPNGTDTEVKDNYIDAGAPAQILALADDDAFFGQTALTMPIDESCTFFLQGFSASISFPDDLLDGVDVSFAGSVTEANGGDFLDFDIGADYVTINVIMDAIPPFDGNTLPAGTNQTVASLVFEVNGTFTDGDTRVVSFVDGLGPSSTMNQLVTTSGTVIPPYTVDATLTFFNQATFVRGDCNSDNSLSLPDAIVFLNFVFAGGAAPSCFSACDFDDSGSLQLPDAIGMLNYLFVAGSSPPPPPFPGPGADPTPDSLPCN